MKKNSLILAIAMSAVIQSCGGSGSDRAGNRDNRADAVAEAPAALSEICDSAKLAAHVAAHPDRWNAAYEFLRSCGADTIAPGTYQILPDGDVFAIISEYEPRQADSCRFEAHRKYIDLQYIVSGRELMGITSPESLTVVEPYTDDIEFYSPQGVEARYVPADSTTYFTFFPDDPHRPSMVDPDAANPSAPVKKIVVKVKY